jgi:hypothetical protein
VRDEADAVEITISEVPALTVGFAPAPDQGVPDVDVIVMMLDPRLTTTPTVLFILNTNTDILKLPVSKVPVLAVTELVLTKASAKVYLPLPVVAICKLVPIVHPLEVIVCPDPLPDNKYPDAGVTTIVVVSTKLPYDVMPVVLVNVPTNPVNVISAPILGISAVIVPVVEELIITLS